MIFLLACTPRYPGPPAPAVRATWQASEAARPERHDRDDHLVFREDGATPTGALGLYGQAESDPGSGNLERGALVCQVRSVEPRQVLGPTRDLIVEFDLAGRRTAVGLTDREAFDLTVGLVDLRAGDRIKARVLEDTLDGDKVLLRGELRFDGRSPWGWTERVDTRRVSLRCRTLSTHLLESSIEGRLQHAWKAVHKHGRRGTPEARSAVRDLAALVGWSDPRVVDLRQRMKPGSPAIDPR